MTVSENSLDMLNEWINVIEFYMRDLNACFTGSASKQILQETRIYLYYKHGLIGLGIQ